jgi:hypothetical protein
MKIQHCIIACIILTAAVRVSGQDTTAAVTQSRYGHLDFAVGYAHTDLRSLNRALSTFGYKSIDENFATVSVSWAYTINRFLLRSEATYTPANEVMQADHVATRFGGYSMGAGLGYVVLQTPTWRVYPFVGINAFTHQLKFEDKTPIEDMNGVVNAPHQSSSLRFSNASLDFGVQVERLTTLKNRKWDCPQNEKFMTIGLRAGYQYGPGKVYGRYNGGNNTIADAPCFSPKGPYIKLVIGFGGKARNLKWKN